MITRLNIDAGMSEAAIRDWNRYPLTNPYIEQSLGAVKEGSMKVIAETYTETLHDGTIKQLGVSVKGECECEQSTLTATTGDIPVLEGFLARNVDLVIYNKDSRKAYTLVDCSVVVAPSMVNTRKNANTVKVTFKAEGEKLTDIFGQNAYMPDSVGNYNEMVYIPKFNFDPSAGTISGTTVHPAFVVNGVTKDGIYVGKYQASYVSSVYRSMAGQAPKVSIDFDTSRAAGSGLGTGWHLMTNAEWAAVALLSKSLGKAVYGNNNYGADIDSKIVGKILDTDTFGSGTSRWLTGSGGRMTSHDNTPGGVHDMNGNVWEWMDGLKITDGIVSAVGNKHASPDGFGNSYDADEADWYGGGSAIDITTGMTSGQQIASMRTDALGSLGIPATTSASSANYGNDGYWFNASGERLPLRGGLWNNGSLAGRFALNLYNARTSVYTGFGFRLALIL